MPSTSKRNLLLATLAATSQAQSIGNYSTISNVTSTACPSPGTAHIIVARASTEPLGYGIIGAVKDLVLKAVPGSNADYVIYPATLTDYFASESSGVSGMKSLVEAYISQDCTSPLVLMGYSQGAQVVADYLSGQSVTGFPYNATLALPAPQKILDRIAAVTIMGDPSINITNNPFHVGNSTLPGIFARAANASAVLDGIAGKIRSYCDALDPYCASAGNFDHVSVHTGYTEEYGRQAAVFVEERIKAWVEGKGHGAEKETNMTTTGTATQSADAASYTGGAGRIGGGGLSGVVALAVGFGVVFLGGL